MCLNQIKSKHHEVASANYPSFFIGKHNSFTEKKQLAEHKITTLTHTLWN